MSDFKVGQRVLVDHQYWGVIDEVMNDGTHLSVLSDSPLPGRVKHMLVPSDFVEHCFKIGDKVEFQGVNSSHLCEVVKYIDNQMFKANDSVIMGRAYFCKYDELKYLGKLDSSEIPKLTKDEYNPFIVDINPILANIKEQCKDGSWYPALDEEEVEEVQSIHKTIGTWTAHIRLGDGQEIEIPPPVGLIKHGSAIYEKPLPVKADRERWGLMVGEQLSSIYIGHIEGRCWLKDMFSVINSDPNAVLLSETYYVGTGTVDKDGLVTPVTPVIEKSQYAVSYPLLKEYLW